MRAASLALLGAAVLVASACTPDVEEGKFSCTTNAECPDRWFCRADGRCWSTPGTGPADGGTDAGADASVDAGADSGADGGCEETGATVDLLVMVDDSSSMSQEQQSLASAMPELVRALATGDVEADGTVDFTPVADLHVGVVSSDMGTGGFALPTCAESDHGDDGILQHTPSGVVSGCDGTYPAFLQYAPGDGLSTFRMDFSCIAQLGTGGCGFEQQLEAVLKAITPSTSDVRFFGGTTGHGDGENAGFLRPDSILVTLLVTDEDDCSAQDPDIFNTSSTTYTDDLNLRCSQHPEAMFPISRYVDGLRALRPGEPDRVVFGAVVGIPIDLEDASYDDILDDSRMAFTIDPGMPTRLVPSCDVVDRGTAFPPRRIVQTAKELDLLGSGVALGSICQEDYSAALAKLLAQIQAVIDAGNACP